MSEIKQKQARRVGTIFWRWAQPKEKLYELLGRVAKSASNGLKRCQPIVQKSRFTDKDRGKRIRERKLRRGIACFNGPSLMSGVRILFCVMLINWLMASLALASIGHDLNNVFDELGQASNVTSPQHVEGQRAGFYTGGSVFTRTPTRRYQLARVQLPDVKAGCGGINLFTGGFSFINAKELENALRNIASSAPSYAFLLGLETVSPLIKNQMMELQKMANTVNSLNINSCQTTSLLTGSLWPKTEAASQKICESVASQDNWLADRVKARHACADSNQRRQYLNAASQDEHWRDIIPDNTNIAWQLLQKNPYFANDKSLAELMMSLSGSLIYTTDKPTVLPSLINHPDVLKALLQGGSIELYHCDNSASCLSPTLVTQHISEGSGLQTQVDDMLNDLLSGIREDAPLTPQEKAFLESVSLPVYKMLNVESAFYGGSGILNLADYSDVIALDLLFTYLNQNLDWMRANEATMAYPAPMLETFRGMLIEAKRVVNEKRMALLQTKTVNTALIEKTQRLEKLLAGQLAADLSQGGA